MLTQSELIFLHSYNNKAESALTVQAEIEFHSLPIPHNLFVDQIKKAVHKLCWHDIHLLRTVVGSDASVAHCQWEDPNDVIAVDIYHTDSKPIADIQQELMNKRFSETQVPFCVTVGLGKRSIHLFLTSIHAVSDTDTLFNILNRILLEVDAPLTLIDQEETPQLLKHWDFRQPLGALFPHNHISSLFAFARYIKTMLYFSVFGCAKIWNGPIAIIFPDLCSSQGQDHYPFKVQTLCLEPGLLQKSIQDAHEHKVTVTTLLNTAFVHALYDLFPLLKGSVSIMTAINTRRFLNTKHDLFGNYSIASPLTSTPRQMDFWKRARSLHKIIQPKAIKRSILTNLFMDGIDTTKILQPLEHMPTGMYLPATIYTSNFGDLTPKINNRYTLLMGKYPFKITSASFFFGTCVPGLCITTLYGQATLMLTYRNCHLTDEQAGSVLEHLVDTLEDIPQEKSSNSWIYTIGIACIVGLESLELGSKSCYPEPKAIPSVQCPIAHVSLVSRHGDRFPTKSKLQGMLDLQAFLDKQQIEPFYRVPINQTEQLAPVGGDRLITFGQRFRSYYPWAHDVQASVFSSNVPRCLDSTQAFLKGLDTTANVTVIADRSKDFDLNPTKSCPRYDREALAVPVPSVQERVNQVTEVLSTAIGVSMTPEQATSLMDLCAAELVLTDSHPACRYFGQEERLVFQAQDDLESYFELSYGTPINKDLSCSLLTTIAKEIKQSLLSDNATLSLRFTHAESIVPLVTTLGLFEDQISANSSWQAIRDSPFKVSHFSPFMGNVIFEVYKCEEPMIRVLVQEQEQRVPWCKDALCPLEAFISGLEPYLGCDFIKLCQ
ncbi:histidine phosphatase superfamily [Gorgonomyces haynaldii]|nr:histidine phosphatase superfamily [Gorgonomyces haynaldii]